MCHFIQKFLVLFLTIVLVTGDEDNNTEIKKFPYMAIIKYKNQFRCFGTIISPNKILTSAACIQDCLYTFEDSRDCKKLMNIVTGTSYLLESDGKIYNVTNFKVNEQYRPGTPAHDIGIITINSDIKFNENEQSVNLPDKDVVINLTATTTVLGEMIYKGVLVETLHNLNRTILSMDDCTNTDRMIKMDVNNLCVSSITKNDSRPDGSCSNDFGNPLVHDGKIIGIYTYGLGCQKPDIYTNVYKHLNFIKKELA